MKIKKIYFIFIVLAISCSDYNKKSDAYGNFEAREIVVSPEVQGKIIWLDVEEGQQLKQSDTVGLIDTIQLFLKKEQLVVQKTIIASKAEGVLSQIGALEEQKKVFLVEKERLEKLLKDGAAPSRQVDEISGKLNVLESQINSVQVQNSSVLNEIKAVDVQIRQVADLLNKSYLINPIDGTVLEIFAEQSEIAVPGRNLYKIANLSEVELRVYVSGNMLSGIKIGNNAEVLIDTDKDNMLSVPGKISWISSHAEFTPKIIQTKEERVNLVYAVKIKVKNDGSLKIGMPGEVNF